MEFIPEISVIVPVYNAEQYLVYCIESILQQSFTNFELILVNDGSNDLSGNICEDYASKDSQIIVIHQVNKGASEARNAGLKAAKGKYITFIDADDYVKPTYLKDLYDTLPSKEQQGLIIGSLEKQIYPEKKNVPIEMPEITLYPSNYHQIPINYLNQYIGYSASKLYNNELIKKYNLSFIPSITCLEDTLFMLEYILVSDFVVVTNVCNYIYRVGYSENALSVRIKSFEHEEAVFTYYYNTIIHYQQRYNIPDNQLVNIWKVLTVFFHKILLSIYIQHNKYPLKVRINYLKQIVNLHKSWISKHFTPDYKIDRIGKHLLLFYPKNIFDCWMLLFTHLKFKYMFGPSK